MKPSLLRSFLLCFIFIFSYQYSSAQLRPSPRYYVDTILMIAEQTSVKKQEVDWTKLKQEVHAQSEAAETVADIIPAVQHLLRTLGDFHGRIWHNNIPHYAMIKDFTPSHMVLSDEVIDEYRKGITPIKSRVINGAYGYIQVPSIKMSEQDADKARELKSIICNLEKEHELKGWIVDLRLNGGGTMYPMLAGLAPLLGDQTPLGYFIDPATDLEEVWVLKNGELYFDDYAITDYQLNIDAPDDLTKKKVVVLTSACTSSSGEVTTLAFQGRPNTWNIGEATAGYTTTVSWQPLSETLVLQLTVSYYADRNKKLYTGNSILPDAEMKGGDNFSDLENDAKVKAAIEWMERE